MASVALNISIKSLKDLIYKSPPQVINECLLWAEYVDSKCLHLANRKVVRIEKDSILIYIKLLFAQLFLGRHPLRYQDKVPYFQVLYDLITVVLLLSSWCVYRLM